MLEAIVKFSDSEVFCITLENEPEKTKHWFRATDLCKVLFSKGNAQRYVTLHCKDWQYREFQIGMGRPALYVCESGVYRMILRSKAPIALEFQDWLTEELLPKLRASGGYIMPTATSSQLEALQSEIHALQSKLTNQIEYTRMVNHLEDYSDLILNVPPRLNIEINNTSEFLGFVSETYGVNITEQGTAYFASDKYRQNKLKWFITWLVAYHKHFKYALPANLLKVQAVVR